MPPVTFAGSLCKIHAILCSQIADVHGIEVHDLRTWKTFLFRKIFRFLFYNTRSVTKGGKWAQFCGRRNTAGAQKSQQCHKHSFQNSSLHLLPKDFRFEHGGANLVSCPRLHLTSLRPCTSRLSSQNGELFLHKYLPITSKLSITNYLKENAVDYRSYLTIENDLKVEKRYILFRKQAQLSLPLKNAWGTRRNKHSLPKHPKAIIILSLCPGRCLLHHKGVENDQTIFSTSQRETWSLQWVNDQILHSIFCTKRGNAILEISYSGLKQIFRDSKILVDKKASDFVVSWTFV